MIIRVYIKGFFLVLGICLVSVASYALDYPHTQAGLSGADQTNCADCHILHGDSPWDAPPTNIDDTFLNNLCRQCHNDIKAPVRKTHSCIEITGNSNCTGSSYGDWSVQCVTCHKSHKHLQLNWGAASYLYSSTVSSVLIDTPVSGQSTIVDAGPTWTDGQYNASGDDFFVVAGDINDTLNNVYKVISNSGANLVVKGTIDTSKTSPADTFAIILGKLVWDTMALDDILTYTGTSTSVTSTSVTKTGAAWTPGQFTGMKLIPDAGRINPVRYSITSNTVDTINVSGTMSGVKAGDVFQVVGGVVSGGTGTVKTGTKSVKFFNDRGTNSFADGNTTYDGICEICHTQTLYHRNDGSGASHNGGQDCASCHQHTKGFKGGDCVTCHSVTQGTRDAVVGEFGLAWGHKKSGRGGVTVSDCIVCHLEGNFTTQSTSAFHKDGNIDLRDPDGAGESPITNISGGAFTFTKFATSYTAGSRTSTGHTSNTDIANVITQKFCLSCHDSNGATNNTARTTYGTPTQYMPFGGVDLGVDYTVANGAASAGGLIDAKTQFTTTNSSAHPVLGPRSKDFPTAARMNDPYKPAGTRGTSGTLSQGVVMNCFDCHNTSTPLTNRTIAAHGNAVTIPGVLTITGTPAAGTNQVTFCIECHTGYDSSTSSHHNTGSALSGSTNNGMLIYLRYACNVCHSSGYNIAVVRPVRAMDVHGVNVLPTGGLTKVRRWAGTSTGTPAQVNAKPYAFIRITEILTEHNPLKIGGSTYSPGCTMGNSTPNCSRSFQSFTVGGTYP